MMIENLGNVDTEKIKDALEKVKDIDTISLSRTFVKLLKVYASFGKSIGELQKENEDTFQSLAYLGSVAPQLFQALAKKSPPAELGAFVKTMMNLMEVAPKMNKMMDLSADEKIELGTQLEDIANDLEVMVDKIEANKKEVVKEC